MELKYVFMIAVYYLLIALIFSMSGGLFYDTGVTISGNLNESITDGNITIDDTVGTGNVAAIATNTYRLFFIIFFGIGLPSTFPDWFILFFAVWQTTITLVTSVFVVNALIEIAGVIGSFFGA